MNNIINLQRDWVCNECNFINFTDSVSEYDIDNESLSCINCGAFEFHKVKSESCNPKWFDVENNIRTN